MDNEREEYLKQLRDEQLEEQEKISAPKTEEEREEQESLEAVFRQVEKTVGTYCEIKTMNDRLILIARVEEAENLSISVVSANGSLMPPVMYNQEIRLVLRPPKHSKLVLRGNVCGSSPHMWKIDKIESFHFKENRSYFRQRVTAKANVYAVDDPFPAEHMPVQKSPEELPACTVLDVSLEGVRFRSPASFERGEWVCVSNLMLTAEDKFPYSLIGQICWADRVNKDEMMFGCRLAPMGETEQDSLCASIFTLQRLELQAGRMRRNR